MNYEKKYKEALERANKWRNAPNSDKIPTYANRVIEEIFPELKESEDERIRKAIIGHFAGSHSSMFPYKGFTKNQILAWLEKQGEQKSVEHIKDEVLSKLLNKVICYFINNPDISYSERDEVSIKLIPYVEMLEKQGGQKSVSITDEWIDDYWQHHKVINPYSYDKGEEIQFDHQGFVSFCKYITRLTYPEKQGEHKSAEWHIEDEQNLNSCLGYIPDEHLRRWLKDVIHANYDKVEPKFKIE